MLFLLFLGLICWILATVIFFRLAPKPPKWFGVRRFLLVAALLYGLGAVLAYPELGEEARLVGGILGLYMFVGIYVANPKLKHKRDLIPKERIQEMRVGFYFICTLAFLSLLFSVLP